MEVPPLSYYDKAQIGRLIASLRKEFNLTQEDLVRRVKDITGKSISQPTIARIEGGKANPRLETIHTLLRALVGVDHLTVSAVMEKNLLRVKSTDTLREVKELMLKHNISQVPVISPENHLIVGHVSEKTILRRPYQSDDFPVGEIMDEPLPVLPESTYVNDIKPLLLQYQAILVRGKQGFVIGIVTRSDLMKDI
ncbi:MAG: CBS domain-containing protein [Candidatus Hodarchaeota archaeon]